MLTLERVRKRRREVAAAEAAPASGGARLELRSVELHAPAAGAPASGGARLELRSGDDAGNIAGNIAGNGDAEALKELQYQCDRATADAEQARATLHVERAAHEVESHES